MSTRACDHAPLIGLDLFDQVSSDVKQTIHVEHSLVKEGLQAPGMDNLRKAVFQEYREKKKAGVYKSRNDCLQQKKREVRKLMNQLYAALRMEALAQEMVDAKPL
jgi:hypothetical protein